jgi:hypothetical protein
MDMGHRIRSFSLLALVCLSLTSMLFGGCRKRDNSNGGALQSGDALDASLEGEPDSESSIFDDPVEEHSRVALRPNPTPSERPPEPVSNRQTSGAIAEAGGGRVAQAGGLDLDKVIGLLGEFQTPEWKSGICALFAFPPVMVEDWSGCTDIEQRLTTAIAEVKGVGAGNATGAAVSADHPGHRVCALAARYASCLDAQGLLDAVAEETLAGLREFVTRANGMNIAVVHTCQAGGMLSFEGSGTVVAPSDSTDELQVTIDVGVCGPLRTSHNEAEAGNNSAGGFGEGLLVAGLIETDDGDEKKFSLQLTLEGDSQMRVPNDFPCNVKWESVPPYVAEEGAQEGLDGEQAVCLPWLRQRLTLSDKGPAAVSGDIEEAPRVNESADESQNAPDGAGP